MIKTRHVVLIVAISIAGAMTWNAYAQLEKPTGDQPYTPTKLEWLSLVLNVNQADDGEIRTIYRPHPEKKNTILAQVVHSPRAEDADIQGNVTIAKRSVSRIGRQYGWEWVKVEVQVAELQTGLAP